MSSLLRIESSRVNGAKSRGPVTEAGKLSSASNSALSTGPVTPEGKAQSAKNLLLRHRILAESVVLGSESPELFHEVLTSLQEELQPVTTIETRYVETMALAEWRRLRLVCVQKVQIAAEAAEATRRRHAADFTASNEAGDPGLASISEASMNAPSVNAVSIIDVAQVLHGPHGASRTQESLTRNELRYDRQFQRSLLAFNAYRAERTRVAKSTRRSQTARIRHAKKRKKQKIAKINLTPQSEPNIG